MKFVVHFHQTEEDHYDLMLDNGESLSTWSVSPRDMKRLIRGEKITAKKIHDHRQAYLHYEGPVSCGRGRVELFDSGEYATLEHSHHTQTIKILGSKINGSLMVTRENDTLFTFTLMQIDIDINNNSL